MRARCGVFLMTSHAGYEGFPPVLVEARASGLPTVVTDGSDTGGRSSRGVGVRVGPRAGGSGGGPACRRQLDRTKGVDTVSALSAPQVAREVFFYAEGRS